MGNPCHSLAAISWIFPMSELAPTLIILIVTHIAIKYRTMSVLDETASVIVCDEMEVKFLTVWGCIMLFKHVWRPRLVQIRMHL